MRLDFTILLWCLDQCFLLRRCRVSLRIGIPTITRLRVHRLLGLFQRAICFIYIHEPHVLNLLQLFHVLVCIEGYVILHCLREVFWCVPLLILLCVNVLLFCLPAASHLCDLVCQYTLRVVGLPHPQIGVSQPLAACSQTEVYHVSRSLCSPSHTSSRYKSLCPDVSQPWSHSRYPSWHVDLPED